MAKVGKELAVVTAGTLERFDAMTVKYGALGTLWDKNVYFTFIKPESSVWERIKQNDYFTVSFFPPKWNRVYENLDRRSGRGEGGEETGLAPELLGQGVAYRQADEVFVCRKLYMKRLDRSEMPADVIARYDDPDDDIHGEPHCAVIGEIVDHIVR